LSKSHYRGLIFLKLLFVICLNSASLGVEETAVSKRIRCFNPRTVEDIIPFAVWLNIKINRRYASVSYLNRAQAIRFAGFVWLDLMRVVHVAQR
jgi:hypothetical protein